LIFSGFSHHFDFQEQKKKPSSAAFCLLLHSALLHFCKSLILVLHANGEKIT